MKSSQSDSLNSPPETSTEKQGEAPQEKDPENSADQPIAQTQSFQVRDSRLSMQDRYQIRLLIDDRWLEFSKLLPNRNLMNQTFQMMSSSQMKADLTCLNPDCSQSKVSLIRIDERTKAAIAWASLSFHQVKMRVVGPEILRDCREPLFFESDLDLLIGDHAEIFYNMEQLKRIQFVTLTYSSLGDWQSSLENSNQPTGQAAEILIELENSQETFLTLTQQEGSVGALKPVQNRYHLRPDQISYDAVREAGADTIRQISFHYLLNEETRQEICYRMPLNPWLFPPIHE